MRTVALLGLVLLAGCGGALTKVGPDAGHAMRNGAIAFDRSPVARDPDAVRRYWAQLARRPPPPRQVLVRTSGGSVRVVARDAAHPSWSPDATRIAFTRGGRIWVMDADGAHARPVDGGCVAPCAYDDLPAFSPDGRRIAFVRLYGPIRLSGYRYDRSQLPAGAELLVVAAGGGTPRVVARWGKDPQPWEGGPAWSPDGGRIVVPLVSSRHPSKHTDLGTALFVLDVERGGERRITPWVIGAGNPDWSRDGRRIVFNSFGGHGANIYVVGSGGGGLTKVLRSGRARAGATMLGQGFDPAWSPDGRQIVFVGETDPCLSEGPVCAHVIPQWNIYTMNADGSAVRRLTAARRYESDPAWGRARSAPAT
jgi:Tol biopolymer transport system component